MGIFELRARVAALCLTACSAEAPCHPLDGGSSSRDAGSPIPLEIPDAPVGLDAYRRWGEWATLPIGRRTIMRSTYDRTGSNERADASHFLRSEGPTHWVPLDVNGPGVLSFVRTNHWHGSPWHYVADGADFIVTETSTADPDNPVAGSVFMPEELFPNPLTWTWSDTRGADLNWVPIGFAESFLLAYERTHYGTGYYIVQTFAPGTDVPLWDREPPDPAVLDLLRRAGEDIAPSGVETVGTVDVLAGDTVSVADLEGPATIRVIRFSVADTSAIDLGRARLRVTWDDRAEPSIDAPIALFFGSGTLRNHDGREWLVRGLPMTIRFTGGEVTLSTYYPMPFFRRARIEIVGGDADVAGISYHVRTLPYDGPTNHVGYFHATYVDHGTGVPGVDNVILDTQAIEESDAWCGSFVGMSWIFSEAANFGTLEGDPRFYFDDSESPQAYGTGTEEWGGGGDYWGGQRMTLPLAGHPVGLRSPPLDADPEDLIESAYRFLLADAFAFGRRARIQLEHGGENRSTEHYTSVAYWYGLPGACLALTDELDVGDPECEADHGWLAPEQSDPETVSTPFDADRLMADVHTEHVRRTPGTSEFSLTLEPRNHGALLRRKLDYGQADQRAEVWIADESDGTVGEFAFAGEWYLAGSMRCVYSNPDGELDPPSPVLQDSGRRWREDELLIAPSHTLGRTRIRVRIVDRTVPMPLMPDLTPPPGVWTAARYRAYVWTLPPAP